jgi:ABC-2 type transport system permease protein
VETVAKALPAAALSETLRAVLTPGRSFPTGELVVLLVWAVAAPLAAVRYFRWEE